MTRKAAATLLLVAGALVAPLLGASSPVSAQGGAAVPACSAVGWREVVDDAGDGMGSVSSLAGANDSARMYAGSRLRESPPGQAHDTLYSWPTTDPVFRAEATVSDFRITDVLATPRRATTLWASTLGTGDSFRGPVLGGTSGSDLSARGTLRSWFMKLASTDSDVLVAVTEPSSMGVYRWDAFGEEWQLVGGDTIGTTLFRALESGPDGRLWIGADRSGVWRSADAGATWQLTTDSLLPVTPWTIAVSPGDPNLVIAGLGKPEADVGVGGYPRGVRTSRDGGDSWQSPAPGEGANRNDQLMDAELVTALVFGQREPSTVVAAAWSDGLFVSRDGGSTWQYMTTPAGQHGYFEALATIVPAEAPECELLFAAGANGVWYRNLYGTFETVYVPLATKKVPLP
ncbi:MAG: WD40/YVTN/BNR-like repeat-containing protein [Anaerolineae bacterium]